MIGYKIRME